MVSDFMLVKAEKLLSLARDELCDARLFVEEAEHCLAMSEVESTGKGRGR